MLNVISNKAYEFMRYAGGFDTILSNWNAADALPWYLAYFGPEVNYMGLVDGFEAILLKCDEFVKAIARSALPFGQSPQAGTPCHRALITPNLFSNKL